MIRTSQSCLFACLLLVCGAVKGRQQAQLDSLFGTYFPPDAPGGAVLIVKNGKTLYQNSFGLADLPRKTPVTSKTLFNIGSVSKTFVANGILKLAEQKKLSLNDNLYTYFHDFQQPAIAQKVTLRHLLTHTSGLPDSRKTMEEYRFYLTAKDEENFAPLKATQQLNFEPGTKYEYSNPAFNGLALIIEKVSGQQWQRFIGEQVFKPAGMRRSTITDGPHPDTGVAHGYIQLNGQYLEFDYGEVPTFAAAGNGGVWSSVEELWLYEQAVQQHTFLRGSSVRESRTIVPYPNREGDKPFMGLGWFIYDTPYRITGHTGSQGGFMSDYQWLPDQQIFYVLLTNTPKPVLEIREKVFQLLGVPKR